MLKFVSHRAHIGRDVGKQQSESLDFVAENQQALLRLLIDMVLYVAQHRQNDVQNVPLLEAKSITLDPKLIYPFAEQARLARAQLLGKSVVPANQ